MNIYNVEIIKKNHCYFKEIAKTSKMAVIKSVWKMTKPIYHNTQENIRRVLTPIKRSDISYYISINQVICKCVNMNTGVVEYFTYNGKLEV